MELKLREAINKIDEIRQQEGHQLHAEVRQIQREIWVLEGALSISLDHALLMIVVKKFEKIDCVPTGYFYPEFYATPAT